LNIVDRLADDSGLEVGREALERGALQWALLYNGRSPRTARQYVDWAQARLKSGRNLVI
jgi:predicted AAA+ superfamily ATPase